MDSDAKPRPRIDTLNRPSWDHAQAGQLVVQRCETCGDRHFPPSPVCPNCNSDQQAWEVASGRVTL